MTRTQPKCFCLTALLISLLFCVDAVAQTPLTPPQPDLTDVLNPQSTDGKTAKQWAVVLGKALFWDQQAGSDGVACASCHFSAGADSRLTNQLSPGAKDITVASSGDAQFGATRSDTTEFALGSMPSGGQAQPNRTLQEADFPLYRLQNEGDRNSDIRTTTNDVVSSQGAYAAKFAGINVRNGRESCNSFDGDIFHVNGRPARQVARRNTPSIINAAFNHRTLWDGAANNRFNGVGMFGMRDIKGDPNLRLVVLNDNQEPELGYLELDDATLASQAVNPVVDNLEMSCAGRKLSDVGRKLMASTVRPLSGQSISPTDSVFTGLIDSSGRGLAPEYTYGELIKRVFAPKYWQGAGRYLVSNGRLNAAAGRRGYSHMEHNFSMFWGLAIMSYEATLISNVTEFDQLMLERAFSIRDVRSGPPFGCSANRDDLDPLLVRGCQIFFQSRDPGTEPPGGGCNGCHGGKDLFTTASHQPTSIIAQMIMLRTVFEPRSASPGYADNGFKNTAHRPVFTDLKVGDTDIYGNPLSYSEQYLNYLRGMETGETQNRALANHIVDPELEKAILAGTEFFRVTEPIVANTKSHVGGAAKVPQMRNVALTPPYTSSGMFSNLRQMIQFYNRSSNRRDITVLGDPDAEGTGCIDGDNSGTGVLGNQSYAELQQPTGQNCHSNLMLGIGNIGLLDCEAEGQTCDPASDDIAALIRFLKSLTDRRVQCDQAPFDHPGITLTVGHSNNDNNGDGRADDVTVELPAVGNTGYDPESGWCVPNSGDLFAAGMQGRVGGQKVPLSATDN